MPKSLLDMDFDEEVDPIAGGGSLLDMDFDDTPPDAGPAPRSPQVPRVGRPEFLDDPLKDLTSDLGFLGGQEAPIRQGEALSFGRAIRGGLAEGAKDVARSIPAAASGFVASLKAADIQELKFLNYTDAEIENYSRGGDLPPPRLEAWYKDPVNNFRALLRGIDLDQQTLNKAENALDKIRKTPSIQRDEEFGRAVQASGGVKKFASDVARVGPQIVATLAAAVVAKKPGMAVSILTQITGMDYERLSEANPDTPKAKIFDAAFRDAVMQLPLEAIGVGRISKALKLKGTVAKKLKRVVEAGATEGITEYFQAYPEKLAELFAADPDANTLNDINGFLDATSPFTRKGREFQQEAAYQGLVGLAAGGIVSTPTLLTAEEAEVTELTPAQQVPEELQPPLDLNPEMAGTASEEELRQLNDYFSKLQEELGEDVSEEVLVLSNRLIGEPDPGRREEMKALRDSIILRNLKKRQTEELAARGLGEDLAPATEFEQRLATGRIPTGQVGRPQDDFEERLRAAMESGAEKEFIDLEVSKRREEVTGRAKEAQAREKAERDADTGTKITDKRAGAELFEQLRAPKVATPEAAPPAQEPVAAPTPPQEAPPVAPTPASLVGSVVGHANIPGKQIKVDRIEGDVLFGEDVQSGATIEMGIDSAVVSKVEPEPAQAEKPGIQGEGQVVHTMPDGSTMAGKEHPGAVPGSEGVVPAGEVPKTAAKPAPTTTPPLAETPPKTAAEAAASIKGLREEAERGEQEAVPAPAKAPEPAPVEEKAEVSKETEKRGFITPGEKLVSSSGREMAPVPKLSTGTKRKTTNALKRIDVWLKDESIKEAKSRGDDFNTTTFEGVQIGNVSPADRDAMNLYLFGEVEGPGPENRVTPGAPAPRRAEIPTRVPRFYKDKKSGEIKEVPKDKPDHFYFDEGVELLDKKEEGTQMLGVYRKANPGVGPVVLMNEGGDIGVVIHKSTKKPGKFQATNFREDGFTSDTNYDSLEEAIAEEAPFYSNFGEATLQKWVSGTKWKTFDQGKVVKTESQGKLPAEVKDDSRDDASGRGQAKEEVEADRGGEKQKSARSAVENDLLAGATGEDGKVDIKKVNQNFDFMINGDISIFYDKAEVESALDKIMAEEGIDVKAIEAEANSQLLQDVAIERNREIVPRGGLKLSEIQRIHGPTVVEELREKFGASFLSSKGASPDGVSQELFGEGLLPSDDANAYVNLLLGPGVKSIRQAEGREKTRRAKTDKSPEAVAARHQKQLLKEQEKRDAKVPAPVAEEGKAKDKAIPVAVAAAKAFTAQATASKDATAIRTAETLAADVADVTRNLEESVDAYAADKTKENLEELKFNRKELRAITREIVKAGKDLTAGKKPLFQRKAREEKKTIEPQKKTEQAKEPSGLTKEEVFDHIQPTLKKWKNSPDVEVVQTEEELPVAVFADIRQQGAEGEVQGVFWDDTVYLVADNLGTKERAGKTLRREALRTLFHESLRHFGFRQVLGDGYVKFMGQASRNGQVQKEIRQVVKDYGYDLKVKAERIAATDEALARMGDKGVKNSFVDKLVAAVRRWLRRNGFKDLTLSDTEIKQFILDASAAVRDGRRSVTLGKSPKFFNLGRDVGPAFQRVFDAALSPLGFFSPVERAVKSVQGKSLPARSWLNQIKKFQGVQNEELEDTGLVAWLDEQEGKVSKEDVLAFVKAGGAQIVEVTKGSTFNLEEARAELIEAAHSGGWEAVGNMFDRVGYSPAGSYEDHYGGDFGKALADIRRLDPDQVKRAADAEQVQITDTKFSTWVLPGGENYREVLLTVPGRMQGPYELKKKGGEVVEVFPNRDTAFAALKGLPEGQSELYVIRPEDPKPDFESEHFKEPNILVHFRLNERTDSEGRRTLFVEEVQSDWILAGRKSGFQEGSSFLVMSITGGRALIRGQEEDFFRTRKEAEDYIAQLGTPEHFSVKEVAPPGVPDAPHKESWSKLAMRRVLRIAVEEGFDAVAWTPGAVQKDRYDLSKQVDRISWDKQGNERFVTIFPKSGDQIKLWINPKTGITRMSTEARFKGKPLEDAVGKGLAEKILSAEEGSLSGLDLKTGGEWADALYGDLNPKTNPNQEIRGQLPNEMKKLVKKWGGKVGVAEIDAGKEGIQKVWSLPITDQMREEIKTSGVPLYSRVPRQRTGDKVTDEALSLIGAPEKSVLERSKDWWESLKEDGWYETMVGFFDGLGGIKISIDEAYAKAFPDDKKGNALENSAYTHARMATSLPDTMKAILFHGSPTRLAGDGAVTVETMGKGLFNIFEPVAEELDLFLGWRAGVRAKRLKKEDRENLFSEEHIEALIALRTPERAKLWEETWQTYVDFKTKVLDFAEKHGVIDPETRPFWDRDDHIPFYRISESLIPGKKEKKAPKSKTSVANQDPVTRGLRGGKDPLGDLLGNIVQNIAHLVDTSNKNHSAQIAYVKMKRMGTAREAENQGELRKVHNAQLGTALRKAFGDKESIPPMNKAMRESVSNIYLPKAPIGPNIIHILVKGKSKYIEVDDKMAFRSLTAINQKVMSGEVMKYMRGAKRLLTMGITISPDFMVRNIVRDTFQTWVVTKGHFVPVVDSAKGLVKAWREDEDMVRLMAAGGSFTMGYSFGNDPDSAAIALKRLYEKKTMKPENILDTPAKIVGALKHGWDIWQRVGSATENAARVQKFANIRAKGGTILQAAFEAKDIMDFSMRGDWATIQFLTQTVPFLGARIQGLHKLGRGARENPIGFLQKGAAITAAAVLLYMVNRDEDWYKKLEEWEKDTYVWFRIGDEIYSMPKPFESGVLFMTIPERFTEFFLDSVEDKGDADLLAERIWFSFRETFAVGVPQLIAPVIEQVSNKNFFTDRPIVSQSLEGRIPGAQREPWTSETASAIGKALNWSPKRIEHWIKGYTGTLGMYVLGASDIVTRTLLDYPEPPAGDIRDWPIMKSFVRGNVNDPRRHTKYGTTMFEWLREVNELNKTINHYRQTGEVLDAKELKAENKEKLKFRKALNRSGFKLRKISARMKQIYRDKKMSPDEKKRELDELTIRKNQITKRIHDKAKPAF